MKNFLLITLFIIPLVVSSQEATKWQVNQAEKVASFVIEKLELNEEDALFFRDVNLTQIVENANNIKESGASTQDEKKAVYAKGRANLKSKLTDRFGRKIAQQLMNAINESRKQ
tara:strand:+ start:1368 stop:1709 length:342 start_codon:yes stop_codon:yes gene_type:complete